MGKIARINGAIFYAVEILARLLLCLQARVDVGATTWAPNQEYSRHQKPKNARVTNLGGLVRGGIDADFLHINTHVADCLDLRVRTSAPVRIQMFAKKDNAFPFFQQRNVSFNSFLKFYQLTELRRNLSFSASLPVLDKCDKLHSVDC